MKALLKTLSSETFVLDLDLSLSSVELDGYEMNLVGDGSSIEVAVMKGQNLNDVFNYLNQLNVKVVSMRNKSNRLEELFVKLIKGSK